MFGLDYDLTSIEVLGFFIGKFSFLRLSPWKVLALAH